MKKIPQFNKNKFINQEFLVKIIKPWGFEIHFTPNDLPYMGKILHINAGKRLSLQIHDKKQESWYLFRGIGLMIIENTKGEMEKIKMKKGVGYTVNVGQKHRLQAITDIDVFEVSTPEIGTTYRLEDDFKRPNETEKIRSEKNRGWKN